MATFTLGKAVCKMEPKETSLGRLVNMFQFSCHPKPEGSQRQFVFSPDLKPSFLLPFLQPPELELLHMATGETDRGKLLESLARAVNDRFTNQQVENAQIPLHWFENVPCFDTLVSFQVSFEIFEITVTSQEAFTTSSGTMYPAGDTLASFRIMVPQSYRFEREFTFNKLCCDGEEKTRTSEFSTWIYPIQWHYHISPKMKYSLGFDYKFYEIPYPEYPVPENEKEGR